MDQQKIGGFLRELRKEKNDRYCYVSVRFLGKDKSQTNDAQECTERQLMKEKQRS